MRAGATIGGYAMWTQPGMERPSQSSVGAIHTILRETNNDVVLESGRAKRMRKPSDRPLSCLNRCIRRIDAFWRLRSIAEGCD